MSTNAVYNEALHYRIQAEAFQDFIVMAGKHEKTGYISRTCSCVCGQCLSFREPRVRLLQPHITIVV